mgnify:CR=1 FL=1
MVIGIIPKRPGIAEFFQKIDVYLVGILGKYILTVEDQMILVFEKS